MENLGGQFGTAGKALQVNLGKGFYGTFADAM